MASVLSAIGSVGQGAMQGYGAVQQIRDRAVAIQQHQFALDQEKRKLAATAAMFHGFGAQPMTQGSSMAAPQMGVPAQTGQPPMPGQPSVPRAAPQPQGAPMTAAPMPGPQSLPQGGMPPQTSTSAPPAGIPAGGGPTPGMNGGDPYAMMRTIAMDIRRRNPGIDDATLAQATQQIMGMVAPQMRFNQEMALLGLREQGQTYRTLKSIGSRETTTQKRIDAMERGQDISLQRAQTSAQGAMARAVMIRDRIAQLSRESGTDKTKLSVMSERQRLLASRLSNQTRQLTALSYGSVPPTDPRYKTLQDDIDRTQKQMDDLDSALQKIKPTQTVSGAAATTAAPAAQGPIATDSKGNKVQWNGSAWVPVK